MSAFRLDTAAHFFAGIVRAYEPQVSRRFKEATRRHIQHATTDGNANNRGAANFGLAFAEFDLLAMITDTLAGRHRIALPPAGRPDQVMPAPIAGGAAGGSGAPAPSG
ncbi:hypothetical protein GCM10020216_017160 [Nonomuraea helvata]